ncbi:unnamed protein product [Paramecium primaurelia]|uniref:Uncharacterized protein n=1 Tax=Paramecium primaurelia TaxID=5886 RepID=A0A8S1MNF4_PARPR|nr:unnamed protein product [Paramecium primaurelia]
MQKMYLNASLAFLFLSISYYQIKYTVIRQRKQKLADPFLPHSIQMIIGNHMRLCHQIKLQIVEPQ